MANLFFDGFELFTGSGNVALRWGTSGTFTSSTLTRVTGGQSIASASGLGTATRTLPGGTSSNHVFTGVAFLPSTTTYRASTSCNVWLSDGATAQIGWRINTDGSISVYRGSTNAATLIGTTAAGVVPLASPATNSDFKMIELEVVFATGATGSVTLRVADVQVLNVTTVQTTNSGAAQCTAITFTCIASGANNETYDDLYVNDDTGSSPENTFFGEAFAVEKLVPNATGTYAEWTKGGSIGANNFNQVDDYGAPSDTDYNTSATLNQRDAFNHNDLVTTSGTVVGIEHNMAARKDDVATRGVKPLYRTGGADFLGTEATMTGSYVLYLERKLLNPDTGVHWSISEINALEAGYKLTT